MWDPVPSLLKTLWNPILQRLFTGYLIKFLIKVIGYPQIILFMNLLFPIVLVLNKWQAVLNLVVVLSVCLCMALNLRIYATQDVIYKSC